MKKILFILFMVILLGCSSSKPDTNFEYRYRMMQIIQSYQIQVYGMSYNVKDSPIVEHHQEEN